jgi:putative transposase
VARVCWVWEVARSSFYAARHASPVRSEPDPSPARRGPKLAVSEVDLLAAIRADLVRSPWAGEGHRKVWARLRALDGLRVSRKRVLRLTREHALLSPHRTNSRPETSHERQIVTAAPNVMWATDATQITTVQDGTVWLFGVVEHWNAELVGWRVAKRGTRYKAIQAVGMAVRQQFGHVEAGAPSGCFPPARSSRPPGSLLLALPSASEALVWPFHQAMLGGTFGQPRPCQRPGW